MTAKLLVGSNSRLVSLKCILTHNDTKSIIRLTSTGNGVFKSDSFPIQPGDNININFWGRLRAGWAVKIEVIGAAITPSDYIAGNFGDNGPYEISPGNIAASFIIKQNIIALQ